MNDIKPVLRQMIDNNKPHWRPETIRGAHKMLDEYEAKTKAWDRLSVSIRECNKENEVKSGLDAIVRTSKKGQIVQRHIDCFESGESE